MSITPNTDQSIANLEREVEVDTDTIGEQLSDLNAFLNSHFLRPKRPLYRQCRDPSMRRTFRTTTMKQLKRSKPHHRLKSDVLRKEDSSEKDEDNVRSLFDDSDD